MLIKVNGNLEWIVEEGIYTILHLIAQPQKQGQ